MFVCLPLLVSSVNILQITIPKALLAYSCFLIALQLKWIRLRHIHAVARIFNCQYDYSILLVVSVLWNVECYFSEYCYYLVLWEPPVLNIVVITVVVVSSSILKVITRRS